ncbi:endolytic transglycosylase MltG [Catellatospora sp. KI3]|uniref:endolytic transglycosylase MltG n=1 Tax=Catellatospora sp. KI3 TaxID=3041620 RepID=UPI002482A74A|nr:endolytic transglycosylase MltG [Catellatospora sp. KI3]MDI1462310.1 endolytic transglycosylase MltG [Catellatospora sp. KI3]
MTEDLFAEIEAERQRRPIRGHRRGGSGQRPKKPRPGRGRSKLALLLALVLLAGLGVGGWLAYDKVRSFFAVPDYATEAQSAQVTVEIKEGSSGGDMARALKAADVVKSEQAFVDAWQAEPRAVTIGPGVYKLRVHLSGTDAVLALLDKANRIVNGILITEGMVTVDIFALLSKELGIPKADFVAAAKDPIALGVPQEWFDRQDKRKTALNTAGALEGFLFPARYEFPPNVTARDALRLMVKKFLDVADRLDFVDRVREERRISPYEALIAASIAQAESARDEDMGRVARVLYNRVYAGKYPVCHCLKVDSAINYWLVLQGKDPKNSNRIKQSEIRDRKNPYNTHYVDGMPIGPIGNPGESALRGAMSPPSTEDIFFVTVDKQGTMGYAVDDAGFQAIVRQSCANGVLVGRPPCP